MSRLQNSPYFCVFKYARAVKQKVWNEAENRERDWGETLKTPRGLRTSKTLTPRFTDFFTDFEKKNHCFAVYLMSCSKSNTTFLVSLLLCSIKGKQLYEHL